MKKIFIFLIAVLAISSIVLLVFFRNKPSNKRPQEPAKPYAYYSEDLTFRNTQANVKLAGTLTLPSKAGVHPAVILITGSGPQNRDGELLGHKPFLVISDYLTKKGIAVLRYDDRGFGKSTGNFSEATALDFATDVESAFAYLKTRKEINKNKIGLVGHSEGGIIAPIVASKTADVSFVVLLAGPGIKGDSLLMMQPELMQRALGVPEPEIQKQKKIYAGIPPLFAKQAGTKTLKAELTQYAKENFESFPTYLKPPGITKEQFIAAQINMISSPAYQFVWHYNPTPTLEKVTCPVLALNGQKDLQVPPGVNLSSIGNALRKGGNKNVTIKELPNLNHFFQECATGSPTEYATLEQTFSPVALAEISSWILHQVN